MDPFFSSSRDVMDQEGSYLARTFNRQPVVWERGDGCRLWDKDGKRYLDLFAGHAVLSLGYAHPRQLAAMREQMDRLVHCGNLYYTEAQVELAKRLVGSSFGEKVLFANSGAEIVELAIKLARKWARKNSPNEDRYEIIAVKGSFHGRTYGALTATGQDKYHAGLGPMLPGFKHVELNNFVAAASAISNRTCAVLIEPVQGEGGIRPADPKYLSALRQLCDQNHLLLIFDEVQCGLGRLGVRHAYEACGVTPDVMLLGKPLGGGLPLSALVTRQNVAAALQVGDHGSTFGGNPVAAAGGIVLLEVLEQPGFLDRVRETGAHLARKLAELAAAHPKVVKGSRGSGLMQALELKVPGDAAVKLALEAGLVINCTAHTVLRFLPALVLERADVDEAAEKLDRVLGKLADKN